MEQLASFVFKQKVLFSCNCENSILFNTKLVLKPSIQNTHKYNVAASIWYVVGSDGITHAICTTPNAPNKLKERKLWNENTLFRNSSDTFCESFKLPEIEQLASAWLSVSFIFHIVLQQFQNHYSFLFFFGGWLKHDQINIDSRLTHMLTQTRTSHAPEYENVWRHNKKSSKISKE